MILTIINLPCNLFLALVLYYFLNMGLQFKDYYLKLFPLMNGRKILGWMLFVFTLSFIQLLLNGTFQLYPLILFLVKSPCQAWYRDYY